MRLATWNINGARAREKNVCAWLEREKPDLLLLQEIKCEAANFPACFAASGYHVALVGQKGFNGVAILSREPAEITATRLPDLPGDDAQARYIEAAYQGFRVGNLYLPNGNSGGDAGYAYKLRWMEALAAHAQRLLDDDVPLILAGDYNVCPEDIDYAPGTLPTTDALVRPETRARFYALMWQGFTDAIRAIHPRGPCYTFWDYQAGCWQRDRGLRIDHALLAPVPAQRLRDAKPDRQERDRETPSDHVPVVLTFA